MPIEVAIFLGILILMLAPIFLLGRAFKGSKKKGAGPDGQASDGANVAVGLGAMGAGIGHHDSNASSHVSGSSTDFGSGGGDSGGGGGGDGG